MFFNVTESGPNLWLVELMDDAWNVYEEILTQDAEKTKEEIIKKYQLDK